MPTRPLVSVIIPVYNGERFVGRTLNSVLAQTYESIEVVVVDDGSTDQTARVIGAAALLDNRIHLFRTQNSGVGAARNFAIRQAQGKFIAPLDADDLWHPEKIRRQLEVMQRSRPEVGLVYCWSTNIDEGDLIIPPVIPKCTWEGRVVSQLALANFLENSSTPLIRRSCIDAVGGYDIDPSLANAIDWKLYLALSDICEFAVVPEHLVGYRQSTSSMSKDVAAMAKASELVIRWLEQKWPDLPDYVAQERAYTLNTYLSRLAVDNKSFISALCYQAMAYRAYPRQMLSLYHFKTIVRHLFAACGVKRAVIPKVTSRIRFQELEKAQVQGFI